MPLPKLKENATLEEMQEWCIETTQEYNRVESELVVKTQREIELQEHNQKLFLKLTTEPPKKEDKKEEEEKFLSPEEFAKTIKL